MSWFSERQINQSKNKDRDCVSGTGLCFFPNSICVITQETSSLLFNQPSKDKMQIQPQTPHICQVRLSPKSVMGFHLLVFSVLFLRDGCIWTLTQHICVCIYVCVCGLKEPQFHEHHKVQSKPQLILAKNRPHRWEQTNTY